MSCSKDSGVSVVIAFVTILTIVALAVGMWALVGIPGQIREANEAHAVYVTDSMTDYKVMLQNLHKDDFKNLNVSTILPVGSSYSSGAMILDGTSVGTLSVVRNGYELVWSQDVNRFTLTVGSGTVIGYEGGGVFRCDDGNYVWSVYPEFTVLNKSNMLYVNMGNISNITGDFSVGLSGDIAVNTRYMFNSIPDSQPSILGTKKNEDGVETGSEMNFTIKYESTSSDDANLWYSLFYETYYKYLSSGEFNSENLSVSLPILDNKIVTMNIISNNLQADAYLSGYTYNAGLVPDYAVKEGVDDNNGKWFSDGSNDGNGYSNIGDLSESLNSWFENNYGEGEFSKVVSDNILIFNKSSVELINYKVNNNFALPIAGEPIIINFNLKLNDMGSFTGGDKWRDVLFARTDGYSGPLFILESGGIINATINSVTLDGRGITASAPLIVVKSGGEIGSGIFKLINNINTGSNGEEYAGKGGAIYNEGTVSTNQESCLISGNTAVLGGGVYNANGGKFSQNFNINNNNATENGGGVYNANGGTFITNSGSISSNKAAEKGGGVYNVGTFESRISITDNKAVKGGGVYNANGGEFNYKYGSISSNNEDSAVVGLGKNYYAESGAINSGPALTSKLTESDEDNKYSDDPIT